MGSIDFDVRIKNEEEEFKIGWDDITVNNLNGPKIDTSAIVETLKIEENSSTWFVRPKQDDECQYPARPDEDDTQPQLLRSKKDAVQESIVPSAFDGSYEAPSPRECRVPLRSIGSSVKPASVVKNKEEDAEDVAAFMAQRENPILKKVKKNDEVVALSDDTVYEIIKHSGLTDVPLPDIDPVVRDTFFTRYLISDLLGGSPQDTFPTPRDDKIAEHGIKSYMCLVYSFNPFAPQLPGRSGLLFRGTRREHTDPNRGRDSTVYPYFIRVETNKWQYLGHYVLKSGRTLTVDEWKQQSPLCKRTWIKDVKNCRAWIPLRAYIRLRRGLEDKSKARPEAIKDMEDKLAKNKRTDDVSTDEIERAFDRGDILIDAVGMQCIRYDVAFQQKLYDKSLSWSRPRQGKPAANGKRKSTVRAESGSDDAAQIISVRRTRTSRKRTARQRRSEDTPSSESEQESDDVMDIDDLENIRERSYVAKGTRSRPAKKPRTIDAF